MVIFVILSQPVTILVTDLTNPDNFDQRSSHSQLFDNRKDLQASTLVGLTRENPVLDPLAVVHLDNQLYILNSSIAGTYLIK